MSLRFSESTVELMQGDITAQATDAVVNAANCGLRGGGGVDGAIHRAGGPSIMDETRAKFPQGCPTGHAVITGAGNLSAKYVIHAVGPMYKAGNRNEAKLLAIAYRNCLEVAERNVCMSLSFPSLSTGVYGYPVDEAARTALGTVGDFLRAGSTLQLVRFVLFDSGTLDAFVQAGKELEEGECPEDILGIVGSV